MHSENTSTRKVVRIRIPTKPELNLRKVVRQRIIAQPEKTDQKSRETSYAGTARTQESEKSADTKYLQSHKTSTRKVMSLQIPAQLEHKYEKSREIPDTCTDRTKLCK